MFGLTSSMEFFVSSPHSFSLALTELVPSSKARVVYSLQNYSTPDAVPVILVSMVWCVPSHTHFALCSHHLDASLWVHSGTYPSNDLKKTSGPRLSTDSSFLVCILTQIKVPPHIGHQLCREIILSAISALKNCLCSG